MNEQIETVEIKIQAPKEAHELAQGIEKFVQAVANALKDGFQAGQDVPPILSAALGELLPAVSGAQKIKSELQAAPVDTAYVFAKAGEAIIKSL